MGLGAERLRSQRRGRETGLDQYGRRYIKKKAAKKFVDNYSASAQPRFAEGRVIKAVV